MTKASDIIELGEGQPRRFGDYLIHGLLGEGGMARVYAGEEVLSHRRVAIKVLRAEFAQSERGRRQFLTEMGILANLDDPHIVRCLLCAEIEHKPVMVLEHLEGWTLREMLDARVALPWKEAAGYAYQVARALHTAHSCRPPIVHRDLKPENIMCLPDGRVKVMDFGIAKILQNLRGSATYPVGTPQYMSPEHIDARPLDGRSDLFSLGLLMWEMLAGRAPYKSDSPRVLLEQICTHPTPPLPDHIRQGLPPQIEALIGRLLAKQPGERPASASEVLAVLEPFVSAPAPGPVHQAPARSVTAPASPSTPPAPALDTIPIVEGARKGPLQQQIEDSVDEVAQALSRFGRATSALIVRVLVGLMILPAAAAIFIGIPAMLAALNLYLLAEQQDLVMLESDFDTWARPELVPVVLVASAVFLRACWAHHRDPSRASYLKPWLILGAVLIAAWGAVTALEFGPESSLYPPVHYACIASASIWLAITMSWGLGRICSRVLRRLEHARAMP